MQYMTGYNGTTRTEEQLYEWSHWKNLDEEQQRRVKWILDASGTAGSPLGIGSIFRTEAQALAVALERHMQVLTGGCCSYGGKRYALRSGMAHAAFPGSTYHEATTKKKKALAVDFTGNLAFLRANAATAGLVEFSKVNREPWHGQPKDVPTSKSKYSLALHDPLKPWPLPGMPTPQPTKLYAPKPTLRHGAANNEIQVRSFQHIANFMGWRDSMNRTLIVDGEYGSRSTQACVAMQIVLKIEVDGIYGPQSARALQTHLDVLSSLGR